ncbi:MAG: ammonium transporter [Actinomycetia bacterium]|nr:ammonium transporter [Actinomycetes bacterium]
MDTLWLVICAALVFIMQGGFLCLESGLVRSKNSYNVAIKNILDVCLASALFGLFGYWMMFGTSWGGWIGLDTVIAPDGVSERSFFLFQLMFCGTAATIVAGAVAERTRLWGYLAMVALLAGVFYPVFGHWVWGDGGLLQSRGFHDFAGGAVVHGAGGWFALAAIMVVGPRIGRFGPGSSKLHGNNLVLASLGVVLLWFGWFGFNGGSGFSFDGTVPGIIIVTLFAGVVGGLGGLLFSRFSSPKLKVDDTLNGVLAGLVAITPVADVVGLPAAVVIAGVAAWLSGGATRLLERLQLDDVIGAVPVHAVGGTWGVLCVALFGRQEAFGEGLNRWDQFVVQSQGAVICFAVFFGGGYIALWLVNRAYRLRVSFEDEIAGLNYSEHGATTGVADLVEDMRKLELTGDISQRAYVEPHTEVGELANQYNRALDKVVEREATLEEARRDNEDLQSFAHLAAHDLKAPLRAVSGFASFLNEDVKSGNLEEVEAHSGRIIDGADRMSRLVGDLLSYAEAGRREESHTDVELGVVVEDALLLLSEVSAEAGVEVSVSVLPTVVGNPIGLTQLMQNLIGNAIKFRGPVAPRVEVTSRGDTDAWQIRVTDNGIGIDPKYFQKIFEPLKRLHSSSEIEGSGLGLANCKKIVESHGGRIWAEGGDGGEGTSICFTLPSANLVAGPSVSPSPDGEDSLAVPAPTAN